MKVFACGLIFMAFLTSGCARPDPCPLDRVDFEILLSRMTNLHTFAKQPLGPSFLESSSDPTGGNRDWATYTETEPSGRITIFAAQGPGYISRFWIASYYADRWLFFFDGEPEPRLNLARDELFGEKFPFAPPLAGESSGGRYCLLPIPFSKSIRIEMVPTNLNPENRNYYQINYTKLNLDPDAVESFPAKLSNSQSNLVSVVNKALSEQQRDQTRLAAELMGDAATDTIAPGEAITFWEDSGAGLLETFSLRIDHPKASDVMSFELLRRLRLQIYWDGARSPSVDVPLGDFFCNPFYLRSFSAMPLGQEQGVFVSRFPMPYRDGARAQLVNQSLVPATISHASRGDRYSTRGLNRLFHARWSATATSGEFYRMLSARTAGHYVGCFVTAIGQDGSWNILEGDEHLYPDAGVQPPQIGTGLEDYFGGAYYYTSLFDLPLHGLIEKGAMRTDQYRFHLLDAIAFNKSFDAAFEFGHGNLAQGYMSGVSYWYADRPVDQGLSSDAAALLDRPPDRFELHGLMAQLFLLEREGLYADAANRMEFFATRYGNHPWSDLLRVRGAAYREMEEGFAAVRALYEQLAGSEFEPAARAARDRLWLREDPSHALLGIHALGKYRLLQDGRPIAEGEGKNDLRILRVSMEGDTHTWEAELTPSHQGSFFSLCLRTQQGDITSAGDWETLDVKPLPGRAPPETFAGRQVLPNMTIWAFNPNGYINMQSPAAGISLWYFWDSRPLIQQVRLRKQWSLEDIVATPLSERERSARELRYHAID